MPVSISASVPANTEDRSLGAQRIREANEAILVAHTSAGLHNNGLDTSSTWNPAITFETPGNLSVTYTSRGGIYVKIGDMVFASFSFVTATFTHTTASGAVQITGFPFTSLDAGPWMGPIRWQGITKANYTDMVLRMGNAVTYANLYACGSGQNDSAVSASDMPTGGSVTFVGTLIYRAAP